METLVLEMASGQYTGEGIIGIPLNLRKNLIHHCKSLLISSEIVRQSLRWRLRSPLRRADIKIRPGRMQAVTKDIRPSNDCRRRREIFVAETTDSKSLKMS